MLHPWRPDSGRKAWRGGNWTRDFAAFVLCYFKERRNVDVVVSEIPEENSWRLTCLLCRDMGRTLTKPSTFMIRPAGNAMQTFAVIASKPYASLDIALPAIEEHTRGVCRRAPK